MDRFKKIMNPEWLLRLSLGSVYLYTSVDIFLHPTGWHWAVRGLPQIIQSMITTIGINNYLRIQAVGEFAIALALLLWLLPKTLPRIAGLLVALQMASILLLIGVSLETFRDIGLLGAGLALFMILKENSNEQ